MIGINYISEIEIKIDWVNRSPLRITETRFGGKFRYENPWIKTPVKVLSVDWWFMASHIETEALLLCLRFVSLIFFFFLWIILPNILFLGRIQTKLKCACLANKPTEYTTSGCSRLYLRSLRYLIGRKKNSLFCANTHEYINSKFESTQNKKKIAPRTDSVRKKFCGCL